jgi:uncharacterized protein YbjQ (UPF0145 family)
MIQLFTIVVIIAFAYIIGYLIETSHYRSIQEREKKFLNLPTITTQHLPVGKAGIYEAKLVYGSAVISIDYFKRLLAALRNIFGGEVSSYETLLDRGRREAVLRMKESAKEADAIINMRLETSMIGQAANKKGRLGSIEVLVYGTAISLKENK